MDEFFIAFGTIVIAFFTYLVWQINKRMEWLTGAMESHSGMMLRIEAHKRKIPMEFWDKSIKPFPRTDKHVEPVKLDKIYIGVHPSLWENPPSKSYRIGLFFRETWRLSRELLHNPALFFSEEKYSPGQSKHSLRLPPLRLVLGDGPAGPQCDWQAEPQ